MSIEFKGLKSIGEIALCKSQLRIMNGCHKHHFSKFPEKIPKLRSRSGFQRELTVVLSTHSLKRISMSKVSSFIKEKIVKITVTQSVSSRLQCGIKPALLNYIKFP